MFIDCSGRIGHRQTGGVLKLYMKKDMKICRINRKWGSFHLIGLLVEWTYGLEYKKGKEAGYDSTQTGPRNGGPQNVTQ